VRGELAETIFVSEAIRRGFRVCKPYGDSAPYDFIIERQGRTSRIQVKSTGLEAGREGQYGLHAAGSYQRNGARRRYKRSAVDFLVGYIFPLNTWYIVPIAMIRRTVIYVRPGRGQGQWERFREAWHLLTSPETSTGPRRRAA
jgi:hypothetical protein